MNYEAFYHLLSGFAAGTLFGLMIAAWFNRITKGPKK